MSQLLCKILSEQRHCERSEAICFMSADCFASLAMTLFTVDLHRS